MKPCLILILISVLGRGRVTHIYRQPRARGSLVTREKDNIGGFKAKT
jgi:hypothetical protein